MTYYSQLDSRWKDLIYYNGFTFGRYGCLVVALSMLCDKEPTETARILRDNVCFTSQGLLKSECAAEALELEYNGVSTNPPDYPCIAETTYYAPGTPQHFFVWFVGGDIWDPLSKNIKYPIKSYRLFKAKEQTMTRGEWEQTFNKLSNTDKHQAATRWALASINLKDPAESEVITWAGTFGDITKLRKALLKDQCSKLFPCKCPPCDCSVPIAEMKAKLTKEFEKETSQIMSEQEKTLKTLNEKLLELKEKADSGIDYYSGVELIKLGIKRWLGLK